MWLFKHTAEDVKPNFKVLPIPDNTISVLQQEQPAVNNKQK